MSCSSLLFDVCSAAHWFMDTLFSLFTKVDFVVNPCVYILHYTQFMPNSWLILCQLSMSVNRDTEVQTVCILCTVCSL